MLELLNQLDGFESTNKIKVGVFSRLHFLFVLLPPRFSSTSAVPLALSLSPSLFLSLSISLSLDTHLNSKNLETKIKVLMATNRIDILDAALLRPGRIDRKIEFPNPSESSRVDILRIHSRKMNLVRGIDLQKVADKMGGASGKGFFFWGGGDSSPGATVDRGFGDGKKNPHPLSLPLSRLLFPSSSNSLSSTGAELKAACTEAGAKFLFFLFGFFSLSTRGRERSRRKIHFPSPVKKNNFSNRHVRPEGAPRPRHAGGL